MFLIISPVYLTGAVQDGTFFHAQKYNCFGCDVVYNELISKQKVIEKVKSSERKSNR